MKTLQERVTERLREQVCRPCLYQTADGGCDLTRHDMECPILSRIEQIISVVRQVNDQQIDPYVNKLRETVCSDCTMEDETGHCRMREHADCALDDYFSLIVQIVEEELEREAA